MKTNFPALAATLASGVILAMLCPAPAWSQGMPAEARKNIHTLFDSHAQVKRTVTLTASGYEAVTESDDPVVARTLRAHVAQMQERLAAGLGARMWDPAYAEMRKHYSDLSLVVKPTEKGLRVVMTGRTPAAVKVAQNHAQIVSKFVAQGWSEHDVRHPAVASATAPEKPAIGPAAGEGCQSEAKCGKKCPNPAAPK